MSTFKQIPIDRISPHPKNVRRDDTPDDELIASIESQGILQPLGVVTSDDGYLLIAGHRRFLAAKKAGLAEVPALILDHLTTEAQQIEAMLVENGRRVDLTPVEEANAYEQLTLLGVTEAEIATTTGRSPKTVKQRLTLNRLPDDASKALHAHQMTLGQAEGLIELEAHPKLLEETLNQLGHDNFEFVVRRSVDRAKTLAGEAELRAEYEGRGLPQIKQPKGGWDYQHGPRPVRGDEEADAYFPGGNEYWNSAPVLVISKVDEREKTAEDLKREKELERAQAKRDKLLEDERLATRMRVEHVADLVTGVKIPPKVMPHLRAGVARIVANLSVSDLEAVIEASGVELTRAKNDFSNFEIASQILTLSNADLLKLFGTVLAHHATGHLQIGWQPGETPIANAAAYWAAFDASGYDLPKVDTSRRTALDKQLAAAVAADAAKADKG